MLYRTYVEMQERSRGSSRSPMVVDLGRALGPNWV